MSDPFVSQLAALCQTDTTRAKWVFVPSHSIGHALGERLTRGGTNWINLRFVTPLDIALRMGAPFLVERGIDPSEDGLGPALIMRLLLDLPEEGGYFRPLADQPTLAEALWSTIRELRMAGVRAEELSNEAFSSPAKAAELRALLGAYKQFLATHHRGDMAVVYEEALKHPEWCPIAAGDCWTALPDAIWTPLQQRLLAALPGEFIVPHTLTLPGARLPRRLAGARVARIEPTRGSAPDIPQSPGLVDRVLLARSARRGPLRVPQPEQNSPSGPHSGPTAAEQPLAFLMTPELAEVRTPPQIALFHAGGRDAEVEEVFRRIMHARPSAGSTAEGAPDRTVGATQGRAPALDQVEIACPSSEYAALVWEKALRQDWPVTIGPGIAATFTRPGRAALALCEWIDGDFQSSDLRRLLQSGDIRLDGPDPTPGHAARLLVRAEATWGRDTYRLALGRLAKSYRAAAMNKDQTDDFRAAAEKKAERTERFQAWIERLLATIPAEGDGRVDLQTSVSAVLGFLTASAAKMSALDAAALTALVDEIGELRALGAFRCSLATSLRFIRERIEGLTVAGDRARPGHLHVSSLAQAGFAGRRHLFVVGLTEGRVFPAASEDPVLLDDERQKLHPSLRLSRDRVDEAVWAALSRLAAHGGPVVLSYSSRDVREYRETYASWMMLQAFRVKHGDATKSYGDLHTALGEAKSCVPKSPQLATTDAGWWLASLKGAGSSAVPQVLSQFSGIAQGRAAEAQRQSQAFTPFDGYVPEAGKLLDPVAIAHGISATALEEAATCGFRHFLKRGLKIEALDDGEKDGDVWLDPLTRGAALHDLYAAALRRSRDERRCPGRDRDLTWLLDEARARLGTLRVEMPPPSEEVFDRESRDFLADLELFLDEEARPQSNRTPVGLEVAFGRTFGDEPIDVEALASKEPIEIDLGGGLRFLLTGRIDRIDQIGPDAFEIIDYKTGTYWPPQWATGVFKRGTRLQHALYGLAAIQLLKKKHKKPVVKAGVYYFSSAKGGKERRTIPTPSSADLRAVMTDLRETIAAGGFIHTADKNDCRFCDFGRACGAPAAVARVESKFGDPKLVLRMRLARHE